VKFDKGDMDAFFERLKKEIPKDAGNKDMGKGSKDKRSSFPSGEARASEMRQPQNDNHLIRYLGQSARNAPDDGSLEGGISQALNMMNGAIMNKNLCTTNSAAIRQAQSAGGSEAQIRTLYISLLTRHPTPAQLQYITQSMSQGMKLTDIAWALLNSREFIFIQ
jgi:hypothetical protein